MPVPTVACAVCGQEVSRRSTLSLAGIGGGSGRACRTHEEVIRMLQEMKCELETREAWRGAERALRILSAVAAVRTSHTFHGVPTGFVYAQLRRSGFTPDMIREVEEKVEEAGGPLMSDDDIQNVAAMAVAIGQYLGAAAA